jgi:hypothetical protein
MRYSKDWLIQQKETLKYVLLSDNAYLDQYYYSPFYCDGQKYLNCEQFIYYCYCYYY